MDERTRAEVIKALRSAVRALRAVETAILQAPQSGGPAAAPSATPPTTPAEPVVDPAEANLADYIRTSAASLKRSEEQSPDAFVAKVRPKTADLLRFAMAKQMVQEGPKGSGAVGLDPTPATQTFEKTLKAMTETGLNQTEVLAPFVDALVPKNWGDVNVDEDLVIFRYETPGPVEGHLSRTELEPMVEAARKVPGALERIASALKDEHIEWSPTDAKAGTINSLIVLNNVEAKWCGCVPTSGVVDAVVSRLSVVETDVNNNQPGWWDAARIDRQVPQQVLPILRGQQTKVLCHRADIDKVEDWACQFPGWYDGPDEGPTPLIVRDAVSNDILS